MYSVHLFKLDRAFGGREEGGWWYDIGYPEDHYLNKTFSTEAEAVEYFESIADLAHLMNEGLPSLNSVRCEGVYRFLINEGEAKAFPESRPYYC